MSEHGHAEHGGHDHEKHDAHEQGHVAPGHGGHGHDDHGHGSHGGVGDYNNQPLEKSTLPPVPAWGLAIMGLVLALLLSTIVHASLALADAEKIVPHVNAGEEHGASAAKKVEHLR